MNFKKILPILCIVSVISSCALFKHSPKNEEAYFEGYDALQSLSNPNLSDVYHPARKKEFDLIHTELHVSFDWAKHRLNGKAILTFQPYFYDQNKLEIDAKGFDILSVGIAQQKGSTAYVPLTYMYDSLKLSINLDKTYSKNEVFYVQIEYVAKPDEFTAGGSAAIKSDKGLYFINPDSSEKNKPTQIWTQGETEASSRWFPTIDSPNEKMTQEIYITIDKKYVTLSNGSLMYSTENEDGTRTDYWKQDKKHSAYLAMMAIGEFSITKDTWKRKDGSEMEVNYYLEKEYAPYAKAIFGNTPEMISLFSNKLGVEYPWDKYHQIIVRDYVSGAMENTTAVIHGEFMQQTDREILDRSYESVVAHELFHHWFGDLVTAESWANLPLNESFADYAQYIWDEHKYGKDEADYNLFKNLRDYIGESGSKQVPLIRYYYTDKEDMFDNHSYEKGGCILHMLRNYVGDEAFFKALNLYLTQNAYKSAEIHHLRLAFEEVTGEDMNWFFDQWFLNLGHPRLTINYVYDEIQKKQFVYVEQTHSKNENRVYQLPVKIDIYTADGVKSEKRIIKKTSDTLVFDIPSKPLFVNFDADHLLVCEKTETKTLPEWEQQYLKSPLAINRFDALEEYERILNSKWFMNQYASNLLESKKIMKEKVEEINKELAVYNDEDLQRVVVKAMDDSFWAVRSKAISLIETLKNPKSEEIKQKLVKISLSDKDARVRVSAINVYSTQFTDSTNVNFYQTLLDDPSYGVISEALSAIYGINKKEGIQVANSLEQEKNKTVKNEILKIYANEGIKDKNAFFVKALEESSGYDKATVLMQYQKYLTQEEPLAQNFDANLNQFGKVILGSDKEEIKVYAITAIRTMKNNLTKYEKEKKTPIYGEKLKVLNNFMVDLKAKIKDETLLNYFTDYNDSSEE